MTSTMMKTTMMLSLLTTTLQFLILLPNSVVPVSANNEPIKYVQCPNSTISNTPVILRGKRFYKSDTGEYFPVKGIAYYPRPNEGDLSIYSSSVDFFTEQFRSLWEADIQNLKELGVNTVRIYAVDPSKNHDAFMCALQAHNIYVIVGLLADCDVGCSIGPNEAPSCYPPGLKTRGEWIINEFSKYSNTLAFSAGNEVTLYSREFGNVSINAGCQKKFLRDMRQYVETCSGVLNTILPRKVPIGMVNWDVERDLQSLYFNCRTDPNDSLETPEWYGLNSYQHCDASDDALIGWVKLRQDFESYNLPVPIVVAEYGCRERGFPAIGQFESQRTWQQVDALYDPTYSEVFAGGVVFEYSAEMLVVDTSSQGQPWPYYGFMKLQYGVGYYSPVDCDHTSIPCTYNKYPEFDVLSDRLAAVDTSFVPNMNDDTSAAAGLVPQCPSGMPILSDFEWPSDEEDDLPCYVVATAPPTASPTTASPTPVPTTAEPTQSPTQNPTNPLAPPTTSSSGNPPTREDEENDDSGANGPATSSSGVGIPGISSSFANPCSLSFATAVVLGTTTIVLMMAMGQ